MLARSRKNPANWPAVSFYGVWITLFGGFFCHPFSSWLIRPHGYPAMIPTDPLCHHGANPGAIFANGLPGVGIIDGERVGGRRGLASREQQGAQGEQFFHGGLLGVMGD